MRVGIPNWLGQDHPASQPEHRDGPRRDPDRIRIFIADGVCQPETRLPCCEFDPYALPNPRAYFFDAGQFHPVGELMQLQPGLIRDISFFRAFGRDPQAVTAVWMICPVGGIPCQIMHIRQQIGRAAVRKSDDARAGCSQVLQADMLVFQDANRMIVKFFHKSILSNNVITTEIKV